MGCMYHILLLKPAINDIAEYLGINKRSVDLDIYDLLHKIKRIKKSDN